MHLRTRTWVILCLLGLLGAASFWQFSGRPSARAARDDAQGAAATRALGAGTATIPAGASSAGLKPAVSLPRSSTLPLPATNAYPHRLSNTARSPEELLRSDDALLLRNAVIDATSPAGLAIPAHLRAAGDAGAYVVQARGAINDAFRAGLAAAGADIVSYVPNNGYLVRASAAAAQQIRAQRETQSVLAWEPYFKLEPALLALAVEQKPLPSGALNVVLFPGERARIQAELDRLGVTVTAEQPSPFGPHLTVRAPLDKLVALAALPAVLDIERHYPRVQANDLTRARLRVSTNTSTAFTHLGLSGSNVLVSINDEGVDGRHPDLAGRVTGVTNDATGHGTHVAGVIASSGASGPPGTNAIGSATNANFRGMAPAAGLFSQSIGGFFGPQPTDTDLQVKAALTNAFIGNNSWAYLGDQDYSIASAVWDAATRDALPWVPGPQPLTLVFAGGNASAQADALYGGFSGGIASPGTAKNVITVGACENRRNITNEVTVDGQSFPAWQPLTDSSNQVAGFSARGNVGVGLEGRAGRFKPDVVAPGTFIVSCRSATYEDPEGFGGLITSYFTDQVVVRNSTNQYSVNVPFDGVGVIVEVLPSRFSPVPFPLLQVQIDDGVAPAATFVGYNGGAIPAMPGTTYYSIGNPYSYDVIFDLRVSVLITNATGDYFTVLKAINDRLRPYDYRYESGTSQAAGAVSGVLALMQEYFAARLMRTNSPALTKALLINGARSLGGAGAQDFQVAGGANGQGWGLVNVTNSAPALNPVDGAVGSASGAMVFYEQATNAALITGQSATRIVTVNGAATNSPLRITLAWTDPPGNPAVGPKLVNDLDLIVTNLADGQVYVGNVFQGVFSASVGTNASLPYDLVNNIENVFIDRRLGGSYSVTVRANRVNVNAVTGQEAGIAQDYALVISSDRLSAGSISVIDGAGGFDPLPLVNTVTNGVPLLHQRVGASHPFLSSTNGVTNQWRFFIVTNELPTVNAGTNPPVPPTGIASNIAFTVFLAPNLSWPRTNQADLDLFVSTDSNITNLDETAINGAFRSVGRGGTEAVILANVIPGTIYYAGVKSEDQMAGEFGFFAVSSSEPFSKRDTNGNIVAQGYVVPAEIPDGAPDDPQAALVFAFVTEPDVVQNVVVTNAVSHGNLGDLLGVLEHNLKFSALNNGQGNPANYTGSIDWVFDDSDSGQIVTAVPTDAPGTLRNFVGEEAAGVWQMTMIDSSQFFTGRVDNFVITIEPRSDDLTNGNGIVRTILPNRFFYTVIDVPNDATKLETCVAPDFGPVEVYMRRGAFPSRQVYDAFAFIAPPGGCVGITKRDAPPLSPGRYYIGVFNPNSTPVTVRIKVNIERNLLKASTLAFRSDGANLIFDDATTNSIIRVPRRQLVADVSVGVRIDHPRAADLMLSLVSPSGTRVVLAQNRGGPLGENYGFGTIQTNVQSQVTAQFTPLPITNDYYTPATSGTLQIDYEFFGIPDSLRVYYDGEQIFDSGFVSGAGTFLIDFGPGFSTNITVVMNEEGGNAGTAWIYQAIILSGVTYATFSDDAAFARLPIKFEQPPFTNINYSVTNYVTNALVLDDGFDASFAGSNPKPRGTIFSGWTVTADDVEIYSRTTSMGARGLCVASHSGLNALAVDGTSAGTVETNFQTVPMRDYIVSFVYTRSPIIPFCEGLADPGCERSALVTISNGPALNISANASNDCTNITWFATNFIFTATDTNTILTLQSLSPSGDGGLVFDSFLVYQVDRRYQQGIFYQPEEPLTAFQGENAFGDWQLEVWDSRVGAVATNSLLAWRLNLAFVNTNPPVISLSHTVTYCGTLETNQTAYFVVNVPLSASVATNLVSSDQPVDFIADATGVPRRPNDGVAFFTNRTEGYTLLGTNGWLTFPTNAQPFITNAIRFGLTPTLPSGRRYYLAIRNRSRDTANFCITVSFDALDPNLLNVRPLTPTNPCLTTTISSTNLYDYYQTDVASNVLSLNFTLTPFTADLGLVVKPNFPLPNYNFYYRISDDPGLAVETIDIIDFTGTVLPGRWYAGVYNATLADASYQICVDQITGTLFPIGTGGMFTNVMAPNDVHYYRVDVLPNICAARFCAYSTNADIDVFVAQNFLAPVNGVPTNTALVSTNVGIPSAECVTVTAFAATNQLTNGTWIMGVVNRGPGVANYYVDVTQLTNCFNSTELTNCLPYTNTITMPGGIDQYQFYVSNSAVQATFEVFGLNTNVDLYLRHNSPFVAPGPGNFDYASTNLDLTNEFFVLVTNYPALLKPGWWIVGVSNATPATNATYVLRACQIVTNDLTRLTAVNSTVCTNLPPGDTNFPNSGVHFYTYNVPTGSVQVTFELVNLTNNADLFVQRTPPLTNFATFLGADPASLASSTNFGATNEFLCFVTNGVGIPLTAGPWFISVVNHETNPAPYCLRVSQLGSNDFTRLSNGVAVCRHFDGPRTSQAGRDVRYFTFNVASNAIAAFVEAYGISASGDVDLFVQRDLCLPDFATFDPASTNYPYASTRPVNMDEWICVATNSAPVPLTPGDWFVAVVNRSTNAGVVDFCVRTTQLLSNDVARLTDGVAQGHPRDTDQGNLMNAKFFVFNVSTAAVEVVFETLCPGVDRTLFVTYGPCFPNLDTFVVGPSNYPYTSLQTGPATDSVCVTTNSDPVPLTPGDWFIALRPPIGHEQCLRATQVLSNRIVRLVNGKQACGTVGPTNDARYSGVQFHAFHVSSNAAMATFEVTSTNGNVDAYLQYGLCFTNLPAYRGAVTNYPYVSTNLFTNASLSFYPYASTNLGTNTETICVVTNSLPVPLQGGDWYLAVVNRSTNNAPADYCVRAVEVLADEITELVNRTQYAPAVSLEGTNSSAGSGIDYYHYRVAPNAIQINVEVYGISGDNVDLYAQRGPCWMDPALFPYASTNLGGTNECLFIATNSSPVPLAGGDWYFAVVNHSLAGTPTDYYIRIIEFLDTDVTRLASCVAVTNTLTMTNYATGDGIAYYVVDVPTNAVQMWLEVLPLANPTGVVNNVQGYLSRELLLPRNDAAHYYGTNSGTNSEQFLIASNSPVALAPGFWFLAVENTALVTNFFPAPDFLSPQATYSVRLVSVATTNVIRLTNGLVYTRTNAPVAVTSCQTADYYVFHVSSNAVEAAFKTFAASGNVDLYLRHEPPLPSDTNYVLSSTNPTNAIEAIVVSTNGTNVALTPGDWFISVINRESTPVTYTICATEFVVGASGPGGIVRLTNGVGYTNTVPPLNPAPLSDRQFYVYTASSNGVQANFETLLAGGNVDLFIRRGVPLPTTSSFDAASLNPGLADEWILLTTISAPVTLTAGDWYLTIVNRDSTNVSYVARVTEFIIDDGSGTNGLLTPLVAGNCLTRTNTGTNALRSPAIDYYVFTVATNSVRAHFDLHDLDGDLSLLVSSNLPLPTLTNYTAVSANPARCDELITLFDNATNEFLLTPGLWYVAVVSTNPGPVRYTLCAGQYAGYGTNVFVGHSAIEGGTNLCLIWTNVLPGVSYYVQAKANLNVSNWTAISPTQRAATNTVTWCIPLPSVWHFFRLREGLAPKPVPISITVTPLALCGSQLAWTAATNQQFFVEWSPNVAGGPWRSFTNIVSSLTVNFTFTDDCSQTGGPPVPFRFYRVLLYDP